MGSLLPKGIKKHFSPMDHRLSRLHILVLMPYGGCNCRCAMCDYWKGDPGEKTMLTPEDLAGQMDGFRSLGIRWILLSGGEPLLHPDIRALCGMLRTLDVKLSLLTNGLLLVQQSSAVLECFDEVIISLDGSPEVHDRIRGVPGAFEKMAEGVRALKTRDEKFKITGRCVIQKMNFADFARIIDAAHQIGLDSISFLAVDVSAPAFNHPGPLNDARRDRLLLSDKDIGDFRRLLTRTTVSHGEDFRTGFIVESPSKLRHLGHYFTALRTGGKFPHHRCNAPRVSAVIEADGAVRPCFFHPPYGNIHDAPLERIINASGALAFRKNLKIRKNPVCRRCVCSLYLSPADMRETYPVSGAEGKA